MREGAVSGRLERRRAGLDGVRVTGEFPAVGGDLAVAGEVVPQSEDRRAARRRKRRYPPRTPSFPRRHIRSRELIAQPCLVRVIRRCVSYGPYLAR